MSAPPPLELDTIYHIWNRGVNHSTIFRQDENYRYFLKLYVHHIEPVAETFAYCLLPNHFHLLVHTRTDLDQREYRQKVQGDPTGYLPPSQAFSNLFNAYVRAYNRRFNRSGGLFEDRFGRKPVQTDAYLAQLVIYVHQNPVKHGLVDDLRDWRYSSYDALANGRPSRLNRNEVISWFGSESNFVASHSQTSEVSEDL
jgi:REP element-mobilizing transposase RayT